MTLADIARRLFDRPGSQMTSNITNNTVARYDYMSVRYEMV